MNLRGSLAACAVAGVLVLSGCGGDADKDSADATAPTSGSTTAGTETTPAPGSGDAPAQGSVDVADFVEDLREGAEKSDSSHAKITIKVAGQTMVTEGDFDNNEGDPVARMSMEIPGAGPAEIRLVDDTFYMNMGQMTGGKFATLDIDDLPPETARSLEAMDPGAQIDQYAKAITAVDFVGEEKHSGVDTEHYRVTMDAAKLDGLPGGGALPKTVVMELFLDDENRLRGMAMSMKVQGQAMTMESTFSDFGKDVNVEAPPKSEIATGPKMAG
jgi:lipoprotein LprG